MVIYFVDACHFISIDYNKKTTTLKRVQTEGMGWGGGLYWDFTFLCRFEKIQKIKI